MIEPEAFQLLTLASARDGRNVSQAVAKVWADDLATIDLRDAVQAAKEHYQESTDWLMPAHVIQGVRRIKERSRRERLADEWLLEALAENPALDVSGWWARLARRDDVSSTVRAYALSKAGVREVEA